MSMFTWLKQGIMVAGQLATSRQKRSRGQEEVDREMRMPSRTHLFQAAKLSRSLHTLVSHVGGPRVQNTSLCRTYQI